MSLDILRFLEALDEPGASFTFQTFDDTPEKRRKLARIHHGTFDQLGATLSEMNDAGAGVFVTVNRTDGQGRNTKNVVSVRALYVDLDGAPLQPVLDGPLTPHLVVESSPDRWHAYWLVYGCPLEEFALAQKALIARFNGDKAVHDLPRVMRLPGFMHRKKEPFLTRLHSASGAPRMAYAEFSAAFKVAPPAPREKQTPRPRSAPPPERNDELRDKIEDLRDALTHLDQDDYETWINCGLALKRLDAHGRDLWDEWSARSSKFDVRASDDRWKGFHPQTRELEFVFAEAKRFGWDPANAPSVLRKRARARAAHSRHPDDPGPSLDDYPAEPAFTPPDDEKAPSSEESASPLAAGAVGKKPPREQGAKEFRLPQLLERYVLIYGTTTVWDREERSIIELGALRAAATKKNVDKWLASPRRALVSREDVVFDPTTDDERPGRINLFRGMSMQPVQGECSKLIELLRHLCGGNEDVFQWLLKWTAYPLQHPGAKMRTAVVMHGPQGVGKNIYWGAVKRIYGEYGCIITQSELEDKFNGWASAKLFVIGNEVVPRQDLYSLRGRVFNMITEDEWRINEKNLPSRAEANHANFVFLSNVLQPVVADPDDRRYAVIWTPAKLDKTFYKEVSDQLENGGFEAFYAHLLKLNLGDFYEHTPPIETAAKADLIELSMDNTERFWRKWAAGELRYKYQPCRTMDAYRAYRAWCDRAGERALAEVKFSAALSKKMLRTKKNYINSVGERGKASMLIPEDFRYDDGKSEESQLGAHVDFFRNYFHEGEHAP